MKYQVLLLGTPWRTEEIINSVKDFPEIVFLNKAEEKEEFLPFFAMYFGQTEEDATFRDEKIDLTESVRKREIQPIAKRCDAFKTNFPEEIKSLNGFILDDSQFSLQSLRNLILSYFGILEGTRKVFISYRRDETEAIAHQLFDQLIRKKYRPFLDSFSIENGVNFQEHLRHELMDSDIILLLDSPNFNSSPYCMEEFNIANSENIPILDIRFNIDKSKNNHRFCDYYETGMSPSQANTNRALPDLIITKIEMCRARAFCIKRKIVIDEFNKRCDDFGLQIIDQGGFLRCDTTHECFIPLTHLPHARDLFATKKMLERTPLFSTYSKQVIYNGHYCRPDIEAQIKWWNECLPVKTYNVTQ